MKPATQPVQGAHTMHPTTEAPRSRTGLRAARALAVAALMAVALLVSRPAAAQETRGRIVGVVTDEATHAPLAGVTVVLQGQQGEDATLTDDQGHYEFVDLAIGTYAVRFYNATSSSNVLRENLPVSAASTLRVDAAVPSQTVAHETYVIQKKAAPLDVGSGRLGLSIGEDYMVNMPLDRTFGDLMLKAPGAFLETGSGNVSIAGASGLENIYVMDGLNVTGMEYGDIMNKTSNSSGGSNLTLDFIKELQINTGGYRAEFGGAMGGVVNVVTKSGTNDLHGSAFMYWSPYWMASDPKRVTSSGTVLSGRDMPDYDTNVGVEVGGPIIKDKLFFWVGFAPRLEKSHYFRDVTPLMAQPDGTGLPGNQVVLRTRTDELRQSYQYGAKLDFVPAPDQKLTLSIFGTPTSSKHVRNLGGDEANNDPRWAYESLHKNNTDIVASYMAQFLDRHLRLDASAGLHRETYTDESPYAQLNSLNQLELHGGASLYDYEQIPGCEPVATSSGAVFDPCPVGNNAGGYHTGGFGTVKTFDANRWMADVKLTGLFAKNELKVGAHAELNTFDQTRYYSGPVGQRELLQIFPGGAVAPWIFFTLPPGAYSSQFDPSTGKDASPLYDPKQQYYKDALVANVKSVNTAYFIQDSYHPLPNLTLDLGLRYENQTMYNFRDTEFMSVNNIGPRAGAVFDPTNDGRSKLFASFGQFYETVPMNLAARYFGGEGIVVPIYDPGSCNPPISQWRGTGAEQKGCGAPFATQLINAGAPYPVQANLKGQYHNEIVAGAQRAVWEDLIVGLSYTHRWLGNIIEDGSADPSYLSVLANPGNVPQSALDSVQNNINTQTQLLAAAAPADKPAIQAQIDSLNTQKQALKVLGQEPKPERTYDAVTLTASKRLAKNWMFQGSYTYSRLIGNYNGLYDPDNQYAAPNGSTQYDTPDLILNKRGPLANDRPHSGHIDAAYQVPTRAGTVTFGLSFSAYSGVPRNYVAALFSGQQLVFLLPRGSAGRTPAVTQTDFKISYRRELTKTASLEAFFNLFNILDERTALMLDDNYTFDAASPIVNGNANDLKYAKNAAGLPIQKNPNFGQPLAYQAPFHGQMGLRLIF